MLSRDERRQLREIEAWFMQDDPRFAENFRTDAGSDSPGRMLYLLVPAGAATTIMGLAAGLPIVVFLGICCAVVSFALVNYVQWRHRHH